jgi:hypothetical protein
MVGRDLGATFKQEAAPRGISGQLGPALRLGLAGLRVDHLVGLGWQPLKPAPQCHQPRVLDVLTVPEPA